jgi:ribosomal protein S27E
MICGFNVPSALPRGHLHNPHSVEVFPMTMDPNGPRGVLTLLCLTCGNRKYYDDTPPSRVKCEKCGNTVFRNFFSPTEPDEATIEQLEETRREIAFDDGSPDTAPDDINELYNP